MRLKNVMYQIFSNILPLKTIKLWLMLHFVSIYSKVLSQSLRKVTNEFGIKVFEKFQKLLNDIASSQLVPFELALLKSACVTFSNYKNVLKVQKSSFSQKILICA